MPRADWSLTLPWARPPLMLNDRPVPRVRARITAQIRADTAWTATRAGLAGEMLTGVQLGLVWYPGKRITCDSDNLAPTLKAALDGLRDARVIEEDNGAVVLRTWQRAIPRHADPADGTAPRVLLVCEAAEHLRADWYPPGEVGSLVVGAPPKIVS